MVAMKTVRSCTLLLVVLVAGAFMCQAQQRPCSTPDANQADREAGRVRTWDALYHSYRRFAPRCDDGSIAEGYSESVARILVDHWNTLPRLAELAEANHTFKKFVLRHVDATMDSGDLYKIRERALHDCPSDQKNICGQLKRAAEHAINE